MAAGALSPPIASMAIGSGSPGELAVSGALSGVTWDAGRSVDLDGHATAVPPAVAAHDVRHLGGVAPGAHAARRACRVARRSPGGCGSWPWRSSSWGRPWDSSCDVSWWGRRRARPRPRGGHGEERLAAPVRNRRTTRSARPPRPLRRPAEGEPGIPGRRCAASVRVEVEGVERRPAGIRGASSAAPSSSGAVETGCVSGSGPAQSSRHSGASGRASASASRIAGSRSRSSRPSG